MSREIDATDGLEFCAAACAGCDEVGSVDDIGLCLECAAKLDRDLIRERSWDQSISAFFLKPDEREALRERVVREHGRTLELTAPSGSRTQPRRKKRGRRSRNGR